LGINLTDQEIDNKKFTVVSIDLTHNDGVDMSKDSNPSIYKSNNFDIYALFRRRRMSGRQSDGNPLIYALKSSPPYQIDQQNTDDMWAVAQDILLSWECPWKPTAVMAIPSSSALNNELAERIANYLNIHHIKSDMLSKKLVSEVISGVENLLDAGQVAKDDIKPLKKQLGVLNSATQGKAFQMKDIKDLSVRPYFNPWKLEGNLTVLTDHQILLVDDLIGSGASIVNCAQFIQQHGYNVVGGISLFSALERETTKPKRSRKPRQAAA